MEVETVLLTKAYEILQGRGAAVIHITWRNRCWPMWITWIYIVSQLYQVNIVKKGKKRKKVTRSVGVSTGWLLLSIKEPIRQAVNIIRIQVNRAGFPRTHPVYPDWYRAGWDRKCLLLLHSYSIICIHPEKWPCMVEYFFFVEFYRTSKDQRRAARGRLLSIIE